MSNNISISDFIQTFPEGWLSAEIDLGVQPGPELDAVVDRLREWGLHATRTPQGARLNMLPDHVRNLVAVMAHLRGNAPSSFRLVSVRASERSLTGWQERHGTDHAFAGAPQKSFDGSWHLAVA